MPRLTKAEWIARELAKANFTPAQTAMLRRLKRDLMATRDEIEDEDE